MLPGGLSINNLIDKSPPIYFSYLKKKLPKAKRKKNN